MPLELIREGFVDPKGHIYDPIDRREVLYDPARDRLVRPIRNPTALKAIGYLKDVFAVDAIEGENVIQKRLPFPNDSRVWSSLQVRHQAGFVQELYDLLKGLNVNLYDGHPYNVMFDGPRMAWVDLGSLRSPDEARGSCEREVQQFAALEHFYRIGFCRALRRGAFATGDNETMLAAGFAGLAEEDTALTWTEKFYRLRDGAAHNREGIWIGYTQSLAGLGDGLERGQYAETVARALDAHDVRTMLDIGCNNGRYATVAARRGVAVLAIDIEDALICELYEYAAANALPITALVSDLGLYAGMVGNGHPVFRPRFDLVLAFAVLHHMVHRTDYDFDRFFGEVVPFEPKVVILDFIDYTDRYLQHSEWRDWYTLDNLLESAARHGFACETMPTNNSARRLVVMHSAR